jgi:hypothetical protein
MNVIKKDLFVKMSLINLTVVALIGTLMRYKIGFEFPIFSQKYLLHAHSHFAFAGWVTHTLFTLMVFTVSDQIKKPKLFNRLIIANLICAFGMLISFTIQGYGAVSITFSTLSVFVGYVYTYFFYKELNSIPSHPSSPWFKAALLFNILSSLGTFYLAYMMASKNINQSAYLGSVYFYLHFQYSGWFMFAIMGLIIHKLSAFPTFFYNPKLFYSFFTACMPAYFLSILWVDLPWFLFVFPVVAVVLQLYGLILFLKMIRHSAQDMLSKWSFPVRWLLGLALMALIIKLLLQAGSIFPYVSKLAFGFRSIVIAYLHLVLLGFTTLFLLGYMLLEGYISYHKKAIMALVLFSLGVFGNEFVLMVQGVASFGYVLIPYINETLFAVSLFMLFSLIGLVYFYRKIPRNDVL